VAIKFSVSYEGSLPPAMLRGVAQAADQAGAGTLWAASHLFQREPIVNASMVLANTTNLTAALMAMSPYTIEFILIRSLAARDPDALGNYAMHSRFPSPGHGCPASTAESDL
jgi:5,10-methylenetetrahydromethanopterin reductase